MRWVVLVFVASCYSPAPYASCGVTCATDVDCPTGLLCFANRCSAHADQCNGDAAIDAEIDADLGDPDLDDDGLLNPVDKCPTTPSMDNRDHDGDGLGDICDPCPMFVDNTNSDTDKIGDACDPRPTNGADVATFYGFYGASEYATWARTGAYSFSNGKLVASNVGLGGAVFFESPTSFGGDIAVYAAIEILQINAEAQFDRYVGVSARRTGGAAAEGCQFGISPTQGTNLRVRKTAAAGGTADNFAAYNGMLTVGSHPVRFLALGAIDNCSVDLQTVAGGGAISTGKVSIDVIFMDVAVDYLFVVTMN